ncbi:Txe/YoeB family addiction module toxin [Oscillatoria amoena NRMC-F 0135]|nr:Txe/YoeB family addiction module toxin [Oscillatoria amoena NRMC-F 0135]MDL5054828.1 Txe/YoeB family addiction module toxin [Oscillatoria laete-virens NRMC-F 0139]
MNILFSPQAWEDYLYWQQTDKKIVRKIHDLIKDTARSPYAGIGKPEPLKYTFAGFWSRRVNSEHRMVYRLAGNTLEIAQLRYHYTD